MNQRPAGRWNEVRAIELPCPDYEHSAVSTGHRIQVALGTRRTVEHRAKAVRYVFSLLELLRVGLVRSWIYCAVAPIVESRRGLRRLLGTLSRYEVCHRASGD